VALSCRLSGLVLALWLAGCGTSPSLGGPRSWRDTSSSLHDASDAARARPVQQRTSFVTGLGADSGVEGRYVDDFTEVTYDPSYRPEPRRLSTLLRAHYKDGTDIDIPLEDIKAEPVSGEETRELLAQSYSGAGGRVFPKRMDSATTPRLWAARKSAMEAMEVYNYQFMVTAAPAVFFIIFVAAQPPIIEPMPLRPPAVTRRTVIRDAERTAEEATPTASRQTNAAQTLGEARVQRVVAHFEREVVETGRRIKVKDVGSSDIDVVLTGKRFCEVGGPSKGFNLSDWGKQLKTIKAYADQEGGTAYFYYDKDTPRQVIELAMKWLGKNNVKPIP
jgi:hypothetical protein